MTVHQVGSATACHGRASRVDEVIYNHAGVSSIDCDAVTPGAGEAARVLLGYADPLYAESLSGFGTPRELGRCKGWVLERPVDGGLRDATGCYPLFSCQNWHRLQEDVDDLGSDLVTLCLVADPLGAASPTDLARCFDVVVPFKEHCVTDLRRPLDAIVSGHHRKHSRRALRDLVIEQCPAPLAFLDEWIDLYATLSDRHRLSGVRAFSREAFQIQLAIPGLVMFRASHGGHTVGLHLWLQQGDVAYGHLGATNALGYRFAAAYGLYWSALEWFSIRAAWLHLGGSAGVTRVEPDGLAAFKQGWATETRTAYFCGRCCDREKYDKLVRARNVQAGGFFPAYRLGEF